MKWLKGRPGGARHLSADRARRRFRPGQRGRGRWPPLPHRAPASTGTINAFSRLAPPPAGSVRAETHRATSVGRGPRYRHFSIFRFFARVKKTTAIRESHANYCSRAMLARPWFFSIVQPLQHAKCVAPIIYLGPLLSPAFFVGSYYGSW